MLICSIPSELPKDKKVTDKELLENHTEAMQRFGECAVNHKCLIDYVNMSVIK